MSTTTTTPADSAEPAGDERRGTFLPGLPTWLMGLLLVLLHLVVTFQVQPDRFFHREGLDIVCEVPINMAQAALGTRLRVRTLDGKKVMLRIPPGTQPGRKFRIKGQGIEKNGRRGDQLVGVQVTFPSELTPEQQELLKKFADSAGLPY